MYGPRINTLCITLGCCLLHQVAVADNLYEDAVYKERRAQQIEAAAKVIGELQKSGSDANLKRPIERLFGGVEALKSELPSCVAILDINGALLCSGALIAPEIVAAPKAALDGKTAEQLTVFAGLDAAKTKLGEITAVSKLADVGGIKLVLLKSRFDYVKPMFVTNAAIFDDVKENLLVGYGVGDAAKIPRRYIATPYSKEGSGADANHLVAGEPTSASQDASKTMGISVLVYKEAIYLAGVFEKTNAPAGQTYIRADKLLGALESFAEKERVTGPTIEYPPTKPASNAKKEEAKAELVKALTDLVRALNAN